MQAGQIIRDLVLEERIGAGGVGEVWTARHRHLDKVVAIKAIYSHLDQDPQFYDRFVHEAVAMARLDHPRIVAVHDFFFEDGNSYLVMSYVQGKSVQDIINERAPLPVEEARDIAAQILDALDYAHKQGVVHRDVKPSNILVRSDRRAYLVDFGIALVLGQQRITKFGTNIGTPEYMSPEQIKAGPMDARTDVYSFGCVLYEMLTGRPPFGSQDDEAVTDFEVMNGHVNQVAPPLRPLNEAVDRATEAAVLKALEKDPERRFQSCGQMADAVRLPVSTTGPRTGTRPAAGSGGTLLKALLALSMALAAGMAYPTYRWLTLPPDESGHNREYAQSTARAATLESQVKRLQDNMRALETKNDRLAAENEGLRQDVGQPDRSKALIAKLESRLARLQTRKQLLEAENEQLRQDVRQPDQGLREDYAALQKSFVELEDQLTATQRTLKRCQTNGR